MTAIGALLLPWLPAPDVSGLYLLSGTLASKCSSQVQFLLRTTAEAQVIAEAALYVNATFVHVLFDVNTGGHVCVSCVDSQLNQLHHFLHWVVCLALTQSLTETKQLGPVGTKH